MLDVQADVAGHGDGVITPLPDGRQGAPGDAGELGISLDPEGLLCLLLGHGHGGLHGAKILRRKYFIKLALLFIKLGLCFFHADTTPPPGARHERMGNNRTADDRPD
jgi:hypothetical protein